MPVLTAVIVSNVSAPVFVYVSNSSYSQHFVRLEQINLSLIGLIQLTAIVVVA